MILTQARRNLLSNKLRLFLTSLAIILGVGFVVGAFVLGDTINKAFDNVFSASNTAASVQVRGAKVVSEEDRRPVPAGALERIRQVDGVADAQGSIMGVAQVVGKNGDAVGGQGPPTFGFNWVDGPTNPMHITQGAAPTADDEVLLDESTARRGDYAVGDEVTVVTDTGPAKYRLSGIATFGQTGQTAGATLTFFSRATAERVLSSSGRFATVDVVADPGVSPDALARRVQAVLPQGIEAVTTAQVNKEISDSFGTFVDIFRNILLGFAGISLFVGAFIIFNAFQITIAQRARQIGLLRAVGASSKQILGSVMVEAFLVALVASVIGVLFGIVVAWLLKALMNAIGFELPDQSLVVEPRSIIWGLIVGLVVTLAAALLPAIRSSRVSPMAALHPAPPAQGSRWRLVLAVVLAVVGVALVLMGTTADMPTAARTSTLAMGAILLFFGAAALTQFVARPLAAAIGRVFGRRMPVRLGRRNAMRNPHRTAQTASALTIGVALVTAVTILASSMQATFVGSIEDRMKADLVAFAGAGQGFSTAATRSVAELPELGTVSAWQYAAFKDRNDAVQHVNGVKPGDITPFFDAGLVDGRFEDLSQPDSVAVSKRYADENDLKVGDTMPMTFSLGPTPPRKVVAIFDETNFGEFFMASDQLERNVSQPLDSVILASAADGVSPDQAKDAMQKALKPYANITAYTKQGYVDFIGGQISAFLNMFYALLAMAIVIAVFGIVLTLALSVFERTREIGLLRAVGLSRGGTRGMIRWEAVIVAIIGALVGLVVGTFLGVVAVKAFPDLTSLSIPWITLVVVVVIAALLGVLAALLPARRAARLNVLEAIATE